MHSLCMLLLHSTSWHLTWRVPSPLLGLPGCLVLRCRACTGKALTTVELALGSSNRHL